MQELLIVCLWVLLACYYIVKQKVYNTYINETFGVEDLRDLIAKQILFSSSKALDVDVLDNNL